MIPKLLCKNWFTKLNKAVYYNPYKNILLYYTLAETRNRHKIFDELTNYQFVICPEMIYGYLRTSGSENDSVVWMGITIKLMSGEILLRYLFEHYDDIIRNVKVEIDKEYNPCN